MKKSKLILPVLLVLSAMTAAAGAEKYIVVPKAEKIVIPTAEPAAESGTPVPLGVQVPWTPSPEPTETPVPQETETPEPTPFVSAETGTPEPRVLKVYTKAELDAAGVGERILWRGMEGDDVLLVQKRLIELGYLWGEADGKYGRMTEKAIEKLQRENGLEKVDGKAGEMTLALLFSGDVRVQPTPTPSPSPTPVPTPTPTPSPTPAPVSTAEPDAAKAPFAAEPADVSIEGHTVRLLLGEAEGVRLYPLCGVFMHKGYTCTCASGTWELAGVHGETVTLMADAQDGPFEGALGAVGKELLMADDTVYVYGDDLWVSADFLRRLGITVNEDTNPVQIP